MDWLRGYSRCLDQCVSPNRTSIVRGVSAWTLALGMLAVSARPAIAQLNGLNIKGDVGLGAGTQAPPRPYYGVVFYRYGSDTIKDLDGNQINTGDGSLTQWVFAPLLNVVTKKRVLGGTTALPWCHHFST